MDKGKGSCYDQEHDRLKRVTREFLVIVLLGIIYYLFLKVVGIGVPCMFRALTGYECPGCGMTRAVLALIEGDVYQAYRYNHLSVTIVPVVIIYLIYRAARYIKKNGEGFYTWEIIALIICFFIIIGYGVLRNIDGSWR